MLRDNIRLTVAKNSYHINIYILYTFLHNIKCIIIVISTFTYYIYLMRHTSSAINMNSIWEEIKQSVNSEIDRVFLNVLGGLFISCSILGIIFNITALFFLSNRTTNFKFKVVLKAAACIDILICILAFFIALSFFDGRRPVAFSNTTFCHM